MIDCRLFLQTDTQIQVPTYEMILNLTMRFLILEETHQNLCNENALMEQEHGPINRCNLRANGWISSRKKYTDRKRKGKMT